MINYLPGHVHFGLQDAHEGEIAVIVVIVEAEAHDKCRRNGEAGVVRLKLNIAA